MGEISLSIRSVSLLAAPVMLLGIGKRRRR
jgi:hypothetical protein